MENKKVKELRELAEEQGIRRYSKMRKAELIQALTEESKPKPRTDPARSIPTPSKSFLKQCP